MALQQQNFQFYEKTLSGVNEQREDWRRATAVVDSTLGEVVGKVYVKRHFPPEAKERMLELVGNLVITSAPQNCVVEIDGKSQPKTTPQLTVEGLAAGEHTIEVSARSLAGNAVPPGRARFTIVRPPADESLPLDAGGGRAG